eukprot:Em0014g410a
MATPTDNSLQPVEAMEQDPDNNTESGASTSKPINIVCIKRRASNIRILTAGCESTPSTEAMADTSSGTADEQKKVEVPDCKMQKEEVQAVLQQKMIKGDSW